jgi:ribulose-phosphate 3-epimerase
MPEAMEKARTIWTRKPDLDIQVDGGVNLEKIQRSAEAGLNTVASGAIFRTSDSTGMIAAMRDRLQKECDKRAETADYCFQRKLPALGLFLQITLPDIG